jgi:signal transduction histidine kinase
MIEQELLKFQDNGAGLSLEQQKLFTPFTQLSQAKIEGHGLGLSIVQKIIIKCGGEVGVESREDQSCRFYFTLPKQV